MSVPFLDLTSQYRRIQPEIIRALDGVLESHAFIKGPAVADFERSFADWLGTKECVGVANGTDALFLALKALDIGPGDQVITVPNTFIATTEMISATGAEIVWADISPYTYLMDIACLEPLLTERTKAILPVLLYGNIPDMEALAAFARTRGLHIVADAAQAHGAKWNGRSVADFCDVATYSFYPGKNLGAYGDAGAVVTNDERLAERIRMLADHGRKEKYVHQFEGYSSRLDSLQAAVLSVKLPYLEGWNDARRGVAERYAEELSGIDGLTLPACSPEALHVYHLYVVRTRERDRLAAFLKERGIQTGVHYPLPLPFQPAYEEKITTEDRTRLEYVRRISDEILSLPIFPEMTQEQIEEVCGAVRDFFAHR